MNISICMIVKNESSLLEQSLKSISGHVAEIIIVDTGSIDQTKEIAHNFTDKDMILFGAMISRLQRIFL